MPILQKFIPSFLKWLATTEFSKHVYLPHGQTLDSALHVYERLGSPGVCCSPCPPLPLPPGLDPGGELTGTYVRPLEPHLGRCNQL